MNRLALGGFIFSLCACTVYQSPGRKYIEQNVTKFSNGRLSVTYVCSDAVRSPSPSMSFIGEVAPGVLAWAERANDPGSWLLKSVVHSCQFDVTECKEHPLSTLVELYHSSLPKDLDEGL